MEIKEVNYSCIDFKTTYDLGGKIYVQCSFDPKNGLDYFVYGEYSTKRTSDRRVIRKFEKTQILVSLDFVAEKTNKPVEYYFTHQQEAMSWVFAELLKEVTLHIEMYVNSLNECWRLLDNWDSSAERYEEMSITEE